MVAGRLRGEGAVRRPRRRAATAQLRAVDDVVVDERRHVDELDRDALDDGWRRVGRRRQEGQGRAEPLATGRERIRADGGDGAGVRLDDLREPRLDGVEVVGEPDGRPHGLERAHSVTPTCSATIVAPEQAEPDLLEPLPLHQRGEPLGAGEAPHAGGEVRVGLPAGQHLAEQRHDPVEPEREERPQHSAGLGDLEDRKPPAGPEHAAQLRERGLEVGDVPHAEADGGGVERVVVERQREQVALHPLDGVRLPPRPLEHPGREVEAGHDASLPLGGDGEVAGAAARVEHPVAGLDDGLRREPSPRAVEPGRHDPVHRVVDRRDPVEHAADLVASGASRTRASRRPTAGPGRCRSRAGRGSARRRSRRDPAPSSAPW